MKDADYKCPYCRLRRPPKDAKAEGEAQGLEARVWAQTHMGRDVEPWIWYQTPALKTGGTC